MDPGQPYRPGRDPIVWLATGGGLGWSPVAPGTLGALLGVGLSIAVYQIPGSFWQLIVLTGVCLAGVPICGHAAQRLGDHDPSAVIWDELATVPWVFVFIPHDRLASPMTLVGGFLLHRLFDISKLPPVNWLEQLPGGWGIMADDCGAAAYAAVCLYWVHTIW